jgi:hypothetical protein
MRLSALLVIVPAILPAQMPGAPVLQNAWATPGFVVAANFAGGSGSSVWAAAASWGPGDSIARFALSGGGGTQSVSGGTSRGVYGARIAMSLAQMMGGKLGLGVFGGVGGGAGGSGDTTAIKTLMPVGVSIGFRQAMGSRGFSVYGSPSLQRASGTAGSSSRVRFGLGLDVGLSTNFGVTGGVEFGQSTPDGKVGPRGTSYGVGGSFALGRR